jgi:hypothetical protein
LIKTDESRPRLAAAQKKLAEVLLRQEKFKKKRKSEQLREVQEEMVLLNQKLVLLHTK